MTQTKRRLRVLNYANMEYSVPARERFKVTFSFADNHSLSEVNLIIRFPS